MIKDIAAAPPEGYANWLKELKDRIQSAQQKAVLAANSEMILLYWQIGKDILERQDRQGWGAKVIDRLSDDLRREFPNIKGFSRTNLLYMRAFAEAWPEKAIVQRIIGQLPWGHSLELLAKLKNRDDREWYAKATIEHGWSRNVLVHQIESGLIHGQGKALFSNQIPSPHSELLQKTFNHHPAGVPFRKVGEEAVTDFR